MRTKKILPVVLAAFILLFSCTKKNEEETLTDCKTCRAYANPSAGLSDVSQQVCSSEAEQAFRDAHTIQEISCR